MSDRKGIERTLDAKQLEALRAVVDHRSVTRAARALGLTQPAVSARIARLEREVGFALFRQRGVRLEPTAEGMVLYHDAAHTLASFERLSRTVLDIRQGTAGRLVIVSSPGAAISILPPVVADFARQRRDIAVRFVTRSSKLVRDMIAAEAFDLGLAEPPIDNALVKVERMRIRCVAVLPADHRLASVDVVTPRALDGEPFIAMFREHMLFHSVSRAFGDADACWKVAAETEFLATACALVSHGAGVSVVDPFTAEDFAARGVVARRFEPATHYELSLFHSVRQPLSRPASDFRASLKRFLSRYDGS